VLSRSGTAFAPTADTGPAARRWTFLHGAARHFRPRAALSHGTCRYNGRQVTTLQLIDVPFDADVANPQGRPLGTRDALAGRLADLLPGTQFDAEGRGVFRRGAYDIAFKMYGDPPTSIGVAFSQPEAFTAIARVVEKTNWCLVDPDKKAFIDIAASRAAGRAVVLGGDVVDLPDVSMTAGENPSAATIGKTSPGAALTASLRAARAGLPKRTRLMIATLTGVVIASTGLWYANKLTDGRLAARLPTTVLASQRSDNAHRIERYEDRVRRRATIAKRLAPEFQSDKVVLQMLDVQLAARAYWNFVDGKFSPPELLSNESVWAPYKMPTFLPATFAQRQRDGYEFEFKGAGCEATDPKWPECTAYAYIARPMNKDSGGPTFALFSADDKIHYTSDGTVPSRDDPTVTASRAAR
jgi:hypothetical protein